MLLLLLLQYRIERKQQRQLAVSNTPATPSVKERMCPDSEVEVELCFVPREYSSIILLRQFNIGHACIRVGQTGLLAPAGCEGSRVAPDFFCQLIGHVL